MDERPLFGGEAGEPVPQVDPDDLKAVWQFFQNYPVRSGQAVATPTSRLQQVCKPGADIGGEETKIVESAMGQAFAVGRKGIYFVAPNPDGSSAVQFQSFATCKVTTIALIQRSLEFGLSVSPDERFILYTQVDQSGSDLLLVENFQ